MTPLLPEIKEELLAAAARRRVWWRPQLGLGALAVGVTVLTGASAIAAGTGVFSAGGGKTDDGGSYEVLAITSGANVCLAFSGSLPNGRTGRAPTCEPGPVTGPLSHGGISALGNRRLVAFVVSDDVASVTVTPEAGQVELRSIEGAPYRYFDVTVPTAGPVKVTARDGDGKTLAVVDGARLGSVAAGYGEQE